MFVSPCAANCERQAQFPDFAVTRWGDAEPRPDANFEIDEDMAIAESRMLHFDGRIWRITVDRPLVSNRYRLCWITPTLVLKKEKAITRHTLWWRQRLVSMAESVPAAHERAQAVFGLLARELNMWVACGGPGDHWSVQLLVYDPGKLGLRPVAQCSSKPSSDRWQECSVGLGDGIAGAAFLKRGVVPWAAHDAGAGAKKPVLVENPDGDWQTIVGMPVFHPWEQDKERPSLWGTIGVVLCQFIVSGIEDPGPSERRSVARGRGNGKSPAHGSPDPCLRNGHCAWRGGSVAHGQNLRNARI